MIELEWIKKNEGSIIFFTRKNKKEINNKKIVKFLEALGEVLSTKKLLKKYGMKEIECVLFLNPVLIFQYFVNDEIDKIIIFVKKVLKIGDDLSKIDRETKETMEALIEIDKKRKEMGNIFELQSDDIYHSLKLNESYIKLHQHFKYLDKKHHQLIRSLSDIIVPSEYRRAMQQKYVRNWFKERDEKNKSDSLLIKKSE